MRKCVYLTVYLRIATPILIIVEFMKKITLVMEGFRWWALLTKLFGGWLFILWLFNIKLKQKLIFIDTDNLNR